MYHTKLIHFGWTPCSWNTHLQKGAALMMGLEYTIRPCTVEGKVHTGTFGKKANTILRKKWGNCCFPTNTLWVELERTGRLFDLRETCPGNLANKTCWHYKLVQWPLMRIKMLHIALIEYFSFCLLSLTNLWEHRGICNLHLYPYYYCDSLSFPIN